MLTLTIAKMLLVMALLDLSSQNIYISPSNCAIYYTVTGQMTYLFQYCTTPLNATISNWNDCQSRCCNNALSASFSQNSIRECNGDSDSSPSSLVLVVVFCVIGFVIIILVVICNRCQAYMSRLNIEKIQSNLPLHERGHLTISIKGENWVYPPNPLDASTDLVASKPDETSCSICLDTRTTIRLLCDHEYHEDCANSWFNKKLICPMCRTDVHFLKIKCEKMCGRYMLLRWEDYSAIKAELSKACSKCSGDEKELAKKKTACTIPQ